MPVRFDYVNSKLCLAAVEVKEGSRLMLEDCDKAHQWRLTKVDDHGSRIKLEGTGMFKSR